MAADDDRRPGGTTDWIATPDGVTLCVREWGRDDGPEILFVHGLAQSHLSFERQTRSELARDFRLVAFDLRGHGASEKPLDPAFYREGRRWADDVAAVIEARKLARPVLVGWSLGGRVVRQYLMHHGDGGLSGVNFLSCRPIEDPSVIGPGNKALPPALSRDLASRIAINIDFLRACFARPPEGRDLEMAIAYNVMLPDAVRDAIAGWSTDRAATIAALRKVTAPTLITHGRLDRLVLPAAAEMTAAAVAGARISWYDDCGHSPFYEDAPRYNRELASFAAEAWSRARG